MKDEEIFELAESNGFQDDFGRWNFTDEELLDFVHELRQALAQPRREWVGLSDDEVTDCYLDSSENGILIEEAIEAKLKEKNGG